MRPLIVTLELATLLFFLGTTDRLSVCEAKSSSSVNSGRPSKSMKKQKSASNHNPEASKLSTDINFNDLTVRGLRQSPLGITTTVENEKDIPRLIDYRLDFQDRAVRSASGR
jgi:hypothetical protein